MSRFRYDWVSSVLHVCNGYGSEMQAGAFAAVRQMSRRRILRGRRLSAIEASERFERFGRQILAAARAERIM